MYEWNEKNMLKFSDQFFQTEEIDGFEVVEIMKRYWACCMQIVHVIDRICQKHGITYYADGGTLLGAVRHQGFIPWDDDMDICLKRPDYEKLMKILPEELPEGYQVLHVFNNHNHPQMWAGVRNGSTINLSPEHLKRSYGCPFVAIIDIFPLDYLPRDAGEASLVAALFDLIWKAAQLIEDQADMTEINEAVCQVETCLTVKIDRSDNMRTRLWRLATQLVMSYTEEEGDYLVNWCWYLNKGMKFDKHWYDRWQRVPFAETTIVIPGETDKILTEMYGDWRQPVMLIGDHDYPAFKRQAEDLENYLGEISEQME